MSEKQKRLFLAIAATLAILTAGIPVNGPHLTSPVRLIFPVGILFAAIVITKLYGRSDKG